MKFHLQLKLPHIGRVSGLVLLHFCLFSKSKVILTQIVHKFNKFPHL